MRKHHQGKTSMGKKGNSMIKSASILHIHISRWWPPKKESNVLWNCKYINCCLDKFLKCICSTDMIFTYCYRYLFILFITNTCLYIASPLPMFIRRKLKLKCLGDGLGGRSWSMCTITGRSKQLYSYCVVCIWYLAVFGGIWGMLGYVEVLLRYLGCFFCAWFLT